MTNDKILPSATPTGNSSASCATSTRLGQAAKTASITSLIVGLALLAISPLAPAQSQGAVSPRAFVPMVFASDVPTPGTPGTVNNAIVFVSRQIPDQGSIYYNVAKDQPGVGPHSRFRVAAPGKLLVRETDGSIRALIDGSKPTATSLNIIDVNAPDVSYDGSKIVFAGLPNGNYNRGPITNPGAWRLYSINIDGSDLKQITKSDLNLDLSQAGLPNNLGAYDDTDPTWLPDGRIVFSSTRYPSFAQYSGVRTSNLFVVNADGSAMRRITTERNGADRPLIDPKTGRIVFSRWWRNHRFALDDTSTVSSGNGGYSQKDGLSTDRANQIDGSGQYADLLWRNAWQASSINPDGTGVAMWSGSFRNEEGNHIYGGSFTPAGDLIANFFPMYNMTEAGGFGGLRLFRQGAGIYTALMGATELRNDYVHCPSQNDCSYGIFKVSYFTEPEATPDGRLVVSWAKDVNQDYGLYVVNMDGTGKGLLYDNPGTTELRARLIRARPLPPIIPDGITQTAGPLPPSAGGPYAPEGTFVFDALNVYANGPVDMDIGNAPPVGSAATIRFFIDQQRSSPGSFPNLDWPILLTEMQVNPAGDVRNAAAPANAPLFEQLRTIDNKVPVMTSASMGRGSGGAAHVAGMNYGQPGEVSRCMGCHAGHSMLPTPADAAEALFSNLAPGASVSVSSSRDSDNNRGVIDRRVMKGEIWRYWTSANGQPTGQWVRLTFPAPVTVRRLRLYNPRTGDEANSSLQVQSTQIRLFADAAATQQVAVQTTGPLSISGTDANFADVKAMSIQIDITGMAGTFYGAQVASIAEIEVIARGER